MDIPPFIYSYGSDHSYFCRKISQKIKCLAQNFEELNFCSHVKVGRIGSGDKEANCSLEKSIKIV